MGNQQGVSHEFIILGPILFLIFLQVFLSQRTQFGSQGIVYLYQTGLWVWWCVQVEGPSRRCRLWRPAGSGGHRPSSPRCDDSSESQVWKWCPWQEQVCSSKYDPGSCLLPLRGLLEGRAADLMLTVFLRVSA